MGEGNNNNSNNNSSGADTNDNENNANNNKLDVYKNLLKTYYQNRGLYQIAPNIDVLGEALFKAEFMLPAITPTGVYNVKSFLLSNNGKLIKETAYHSQNQRKSQ